VSQAGEIAHMVAPSALFMRICVAYIDAMTFQTVSPTAEGRHVAIAGAGVIGLSCAFELVRRGARVTLFDPADISQSTSWAAAGMIAPAYELMLHGGQIDDAMSTLCFASADHWPDWARAVREASGLPVGHDTRPTLAIARTGEEVVRLDALFEQLRAGGKQVFRPVHGLIVGGARSALQLCSDHQVDNRKLLTALKAAIGRGGGKLVRQAVETRDEIEALAGEVDAIVWARGTRETCVSNMVKGQALALHPVAGGPTQVIRYGGGYIVPKADRIVIGATSEADFASAEVSYKATDALLQEARAVCPALSGARVSERWSGLRPLAPSGLPVIGRLGEGKDDFVATAHYRNGILLAPVTAKLIADAVEGHTVSQISKAFQPTRGMAATA